MTGWIELSETEAERHPLCGVHGWSMVLAISLIVAAISIVTCMMDSLDLSTLRHLPALFVLLRLEEILQWITAGACVALFFGLVHHKTWFQAAFVAVTIFASVWPFALLAVAPLALAQDGIAFSIGKAVTPDFLVSWLTPAISGAAWIAYVLRSRRINVTTRRRIRRDDAHGARVLVRREPSFGI